LAVYPANAFNFTLALGLFVLRWRRKRANLPPSGFRAWSVAVSFSIAANIYLLIMPWYPPSTGRYGGDVSFWYATYCAVGLAILAACGIYYYVWIHLLPKLRHYQIRQGVVELDGGAITHTLVRVPNSEVADWDANHDVVGRSLTHRQARKTKEEEEKAGRT
jgi:amino acid transporter